MQMSLPSAPMADYRLPLGAMPNGVTSPSRSYATPKGGAAPAPRAAECLSPFSPAARANAADEARLLTALNTRLKRRIDDVERTAAKGGWERDACRTAAKKELDDLGEAVTAALGDAPPQEGGPNAALRADLLRSFDALAGAVAAVPSVVAPVQRALANWAGAVGSAVAFTLAGPPRKPLPPLPTQQAQAAPPASPARPPVASPAPSGAAVAAAIEAAAAAEVTAEMTPQRRAAATPEAAALMSPAWWARPEPTAVVAAEAEAVAEAPPAAAEQAEPQESAQEPLPAAAGGCCVIS